MGSKYVHCMLYNTALIGKRKQKFLQQRPTRSTKPVPSPYRARHKKAKKGSTVFFLGLKLKKCLLLLGYIELFLQAASASKSRKVPPARELGRAETRVPPFPRAEERKAGAAVSLEGSESKARALSAGDGTLGTRWRCRTESRSLRGPGDRKTRHRILTFEPVAGSARWRQPLVPDIKTLGAFPREGVARTGTERRASGLGAEAPGAARGSWFPVRAPRVGGGRGFAARLRTSSLRRRWCVRLCVCMLAARARRIWWRSRVVFFLFFLPPTRISGRESGFWKSLWKVSGI